LLHYCTFLLIFEIPRKSSKKCQNAKTLKRQSIKTPRRQNAKAPKRQCAKTKMPKRRGGGDDSCHQNKRNAEARERAMMKALDLIKESNEVLQLADGHPGVHLAGQSKEDAFDYCSTFLIKISVSI
jgi:hypothetical protein